MPDQILVVERHSYSEPFCFADRKAVCRTVVGLRVGVTIIAGRIALSRALYRHRGRQRRESNPFTTGQHRPASRTREADCIRSIAAGGHGGHLPASQDAISRNLAVRGSRFVAFVPVPIFGSRSASQRTKLGPLFANAFQQAKFWLTTCCHSRQQRLTAVPRSMPNAISNRCRSRHSPAQLV